MALEALTRYLERVAGRAGWQQIVEHAWGDTPLPNGHHEVVAAYHPTLTLGDLQRIYRTMIVSRKLDDRELILQRQGQAWFSASCAGQEAALCAAGLVLRPTDPLWGYYRVQGPTFIIEYDNVQNGANHVHSVWHDPASNFGEDILRAHHEAEHNK